LSFLRLFHLSKLCLEVVDLCHGRSFALVRFFTFSPHLDMQFGSEPSLKKSRWSTVANSEDWSRDFTQALGLQPKSDV
jgi:hypothetical protein